MRQLKILKNNITALKNYHQKKVHLTNAPTYIWLEPTNHCNLRCVMCPNGAGKIQIQKGYMDFNLFCRIIDDVASFASAITLAVGGESLLHPKFSEMVRYASSKKIKVLLNTNATLLTPEKSEALIDSGISYISFAFDGFTKKGYEKARRGANFEKTLNNIKTFLEIKKQKGLKRPYCVLSVLKLDLEPYTEEDKKRFLSKLSGLIDEVRMREVATWGSTFKDENSFSHRDHHNYFSPCSRLWSSICITWDGDVVPCIYNANHEYVLGSLLEDNLLSIWNSQKMKDLRQGMLDGNYIELSPLCENCIVTGTPNILGIPSGIRLSLADAMTNYLGYGFEKITLSLINTVLKNRFSSSRLK